MLVAATRTIAFSAGRDDVRANITTAVVPTDEAIYLENSQRSSARRGQHPAAAPEARDRLA